MLTLQTATGLAALIALATALTDPVAAAAAPAAAEPFSPGLPASGTSPSYDDTTFDMLALADPDANANATATTPHDHTLVLRQANPCASTYTQCAGAPSLCCPSSSRCLADARGMIGCCPNGAACTGYVGSEPTPGATSSAAPPSSMGGGMTTTSAAGGVVGSLTATGTGAGQTIFAAGAGEVRERGAGFGAALVALVGALVV